MCFIEKSMAVSLFPLSAMFCVLVTLPVYTFSLFSTKSPSVIIVVNFPLVFLAFVIDPPVILAITERFIFCILYGTVMSYESKQERKPAPYISFSELSESARRLVKSSSSALTLTS